MGLDAYQWSSTLSTMGLDAYQWSSTCQWATGARGCGHRWTGGAVGHAGLCATKASPLRCWHPDTPATRAGWHGRHGRTGGVASSAGLCAAKVVSLRSWQPETWSAATPPARISPPGTATALWQHRSDLNRFLPPFARRAFWSFHEASSRPLESQQFATGSKISQLPAYSDSIVESPRIRVVRTVTIYLTRTAT